MVQGTPFNFSYDGNNHMISAIDPGTSGASSAQYYYDAEGRRVKKVTCNGNVVCTSGSTNLKTIVYVYDASGQLAAEYGDGPSVSGTQYYTADHLGSTRLITDQSGNVAERLDYFPFGEGFAPGMNGRSTEYPLYNAGARPANPKDGESIKFTGKERDSETGLDYFGARYFASAQGRFTSADAPFADQHTVDPQSWNLYGYVRNNPLANIDSTGRGCNAVNNSSGFCQRADLYGNLDALVGSKTRFFAAASAASQQLADVALPGATVVLPFMGPVAVSPETHRFLESTGQALEKLNLESAGRILSGQMTGSEEMLDRSMVHREQTEVQKQLDQFKVANAQAYGTAIGELNTLLNGSGAKTQGLTQVGNLIFQTDKAYSTFLGGVRKSLGHDINFANQEDREAIGNALVRHIRDGGCDVTGDKVACR